jgi:transposase
MAKATRAEWAKRVERWRDSGLTAKEFAAEIDVTPSSLTFWKWKLRQLQTDTTNRGAAVKLEKRTASESPSQFVRLVPMQAPSAQTSALELMLGDGIVLRVPKDFDEPTLVRVVGLLGARR